MNDKDKTAAVLGIGAGIGFIVGSYYTTWKIKKQLGVQSRLVANGLINVAEKARRENMSEEEILQELKTELEFINIANKTKF